MIARAQGYTLIEILAVLALIGLLTGMAVLSVGATGSPIEREARRLSATLRMAADESRLQGRVLGLKFDSLGYSYYELLPGGARDETGLGLAWRPLTGRGSLAPRSWPARMRFQLKIGGRDVEVRLPDTSLPPQVLLLPEGEFTPFSLKLTRDSPEAGTEVDFAATGLTEITGP